MQILNPKPQTLNPMKSVYPVCLARLSLISLSHLTSVSHQSLPSVPLICSPEPVAWCDKGPVAKDGCEILMGGSTYVYV